MQLFYRMIVPAAALLLIAACSDDADQASTTASSANPSSSSTAVDGRWYTKEQVASGKHLFQLHCSTCHGSRAQSVPDWKKTDSSGFYPPPPLNGTAHTWHHSLNLLRKTVREGGVRLGGQMPGFANKLKAHEIDAILAWVQSLWTEQIYRAWYTRSGLAKR